MSCPAGCACGLGRSASACWKGAVHGACRAGGFAGTIQAFVPYDLLAQYKSVLEGVFGEGACYVLNIRNYGGVHVHENM